VFGVNVRAAEPLHVYLFAGHRTDDAGGGDGHPSDVLDHDEEVTEDGCVRRPCDVRAVEDAYLGDLPRQSTLVVEHPAAAVAVHVGVAGFALLGVEAGAGGVDETEHRDAEVHRSLLDTDDLLDAHLAERPGLDGVIVGRKRHLPAVDDADTGEEAVGGEFVVVAVAGERAVLVRYLVEDGVQSLADEQFTEVLDLLVPPWWPTREDALYLLSEFLLAVGDDAPLLVPVLARVGQFAAVAGSQFHGRPEVLGDGRGDGLCDLLVRVVDVYLHGCDPA
jgi:hypothetical protein